MSNEPKLKLHLRSFGCQMNMYDTAKLEAYLTRRMNFITTADVTEADLVIFNTCHIREKADAKLYSDLGKLQPLYIAKKQRGEYLGIIIAGCIAQAEGDEIFKRAPYVSAVVGPESYKQLPEIIRTIFTYKKKVSEALEFKPREKFQMFDEISTSTFPHSSYVTIQEGCDKFCSYCVVPYTRGKEYSRPISDILAEIAQLQVPEITLLGQNVSAFAGEYQGKKLNLAGLIEEVAKFPHIQRIRYTTSYPSEITQDLIDLHGGLPKLMPYIHLPVQSGSDKILAAMNRRHDREFYLQLVARLRKACPHIAISTDLIVGFPGETEADFKDTLDLVKQVNFAQHFFFKYSRRYGTPAAAMANQVPNAVKTERILRLQTILEQQQLLFNQACAGKDISVLIEDYAQEHPHSLFGRSEYMQTVIMPVIDGKELLGKIVTVRVQEGRANEILGTITHIDNN